MATQKHAGFQAEGPDGSGSYWRRAHDRLFQVIAWEKCQGRGPSEALAAYHDFAGQPDEWPRRLITMVIDKKAKLRPDWGIG
jgi:hypothetical protein